MADAVAPVVATAKRWFKSRTLWVNALTVVAVVLDKLTGLNMINAKYVATALAVVNLVLRVLTDKPISK